MENQTNHGASGARGQMQVQGDGRSGQHSASTAVTAGATYYDESDVEVFDAEAIDPMEAPAGRRAASFAAMAYKSTMQGEARRRPGELIDAWDDDALSNDLSSAHAADRAGAKAAETAQAPVSSVPPSPASAAPGTAAAASAWSANASAAASPAEHKAPSAQTAAMPAVTPAVSSEHTYTEQDSTSPDYSHENTGSASAAADAAGTDVTASDVDASDAIAATAYSKTISDKGSTQVQHDVPGTAGVDTWDADDTATTSMDSAASGVIKDSSAESDSLTGQREEGSDREQPQNYHNYTSGVEDDSRHRETTFMTDEQNRAQEVQSQAGHNEHSSGHALAAEPAAAGGAAGAAAHGAPWPGQMPPGVWPYPWGPRGAVQGMPQGMPPGVTPPGMPQGMPPGIPQGMPPGMMMPPGFYPPPGHQGAQMRFAPWPYPPFPSAPGAHAAPVAPQQPHGADEPAAGGGSAPGVQPEVDMHGAGAATVHEQGHKPVLEQQDKSAAGSAGAASAESAGGDGRSAHESAREIPVRQAAPAGASAQKEAAACFGVSTMPGGQPQAAAAAGGWGVARAVGGQNHVAGGSGGSAGGGSGGRRGGPGHNHYGDNSWDNIGNGAVKSFNEKEKWSDSLAIHIFMVAIISLLLLIPSLFFESILSDRQYTENRAIESITTPWGDEQLVADPLLFLSSPITKVTVEQYERDGEIYTRQNRKVIENKWFFIADNAHSSSTLSSETRRRGNYEALLYKVKVEQQGSFDLNHVIELMGRKDEDFRVGNADIRLYFGVSDTAGIDELHYININGRDFAAEPSSSGHTGFTVTLSSEDISKIMKRLPLGEETHALDDRPALYNTMNADAERARQDHTAVAHADRNEGGVYSLIRPGQIVYRAAFTLRGSQKFMYLPLSVESSTVIAGSGIVPSFQGRFLPSEHKVSEDQKSFEALYRMSSLATGTADHFEYDDFHIRSKNAFEVSLADRSISYTLIERLTKYVLLFIAMTFVTVLAFEIVSRRSVSLVQYVVVGAALILFYMVLLSMSEHFSFTLSYVTAALLMSGMIALYLKAVLNSKRSAICIGLMLLAMYSVLFAIVHIQAYALLVGTILLVVMLGVIMFITRRLNQDGFQILDEDGKLFGSFKKNKAGGTAAAPSGASNERAPAAAAAPGAAAAAPAATAAAAHTAPGNAAAGSHEHSRIRTAPVSVPAAAPVHPSHEEGMKHSPDKDETGK